jgi:hypothetical protein
LVNNPILFPFSAILFPTCPTDGFMSAALEIGIDHFEGKVETIDTP